MKNNIGKRVKLINMPNDPHPVPVGTEGTIDSVDDAGHIHVKWDNGSSLSLLPGIDEYEIIETVTDMQSEIDAIQSYLKTTTEPFDDWDWDGNILNIYLDNKVVETYNRETLVELGVIKNVAANGFKIVAFPEDLDYKYYVIDEDDDNYLTVQEEKLELWKKANKTEKAEYYSEWIPRNEMVELGKNDVAANGKQVSDWTKPEFLNQDDWDNLALIKELYEKGKYKQAMSEASQLDTIVREEIPLDVWVAIGGTLTKTGKEKLNKAASGTEISKSLSGKKIKFENKEGVIDKVDNTGKIHVKLDDDKISILTPGTDKYEIIFADEDFSKYMGNKGETFVIDKAGSGEKTMYYLIKSTSPHRMVDTLFSSEEEVEKYAKKRGLVIKNKFEEQYAAADGTEIIGENDVINYLVDKYGVDKEEISVGRANNGKWNIFIKNAEIDDGTVSKWEKDVNAKFTKGNIVHKTIAFSANNRVSYYNGDLTFKNIKDLTGITPVRIERIKYYEIGNVDPFIKWSADELKNKFGLDVQNIIVAKNNLPDGGVEITEAFAVTDDEKTHFKYSPLTHEWWSAEIDKMKNGSDLTSFMEKHERQDVHKMNLDASKMDYGQWVHRHDWTIEKLMEKENVDPGSGTEFAKKIYNKARENAEYAGGGSVGSVFKKGDIVKMKNFKSPGRRSEFFYIMEDVLQGNNIIVRPSDYGVINTYEEEIERVEYWKEKDILLENKSRLWDKNKPNYYHEVSLSVNPSELTLFVSQDDWNKKFDLIGDALEKYNISARVKLASNGKAISVELGHDYRNDRAVEKAIVKYSGLRGNHVDYSVMASTSDDGIKVRHIYGKKNITRALMRDGGAVTEEPIVITSLTEVYDNWGRRQVTRKHTEIIDALKNADDWNDDMYFRDEDKNVYDPSDLAGLNVKVGNEVFTVPEDPNKAKRGKAVKNLTELTLEEEKAWEQSFSMAIDDGMDDTDADKFAWLDIQGQFPRLVKFDGIKPEAKQGKHINGGRTFNYDVFSVEYEMDDDIPVIISVKKDGIIIDTELLSEEMLNNIEAEAANDDIQMQVESAEYNREDFASDGKKVGEKIKASFYKYGKYSGDVDIDFDEIPKTLLIDEEAADSINFRKEDQDKFFYVAPSDIEYVDDEFSGVKRAYAVVEKIAKDGTSIDQRGKIGKVLHEFKEGKLHDSHGNLVTDRKQAIAIALSVAGVSKAANGAAVAPDEGDDKPKHKPHSATPMKIVVFKNKNNPGIVITVKAYPNMSIFEIDNPRNIRFPFVVGQVLNMGHKTWACTNGYLVNNEDPCPEKRVMGIKVSDIPAGHPLRHIYPGKFMANGGGIGASFKVQKIKKGLNKKDSKNWEKTDDVYYKYIDAVYKRKELAEKDLSNEYDYYVHDVEGPDLKVPISAKGKKIGGISSYQDFKQALIELAGKTNSGEEFKDKVFSGDLRQYMPKYFTDLRRDIFGISDAEWTALGASTTVIPRVNLEASWYILVKKQAADGIEIEALEEELGRLVRWRNEYGSSGSDEKIKNLRKRIEILKTNPPKPSTYMVEEHEVDFDHLGYPYIKIPIYDTGLRIGDLLVFGKGDRNNIEELLSNLKQEYSKFKQDKSKYIDEHPNQIVDAYSNGGGINKKLRYDDSYGESSIGGTEKAARGLKISALREELKRYNSRIEELEAELKDPEISDSRRTEIEVNLLPDLVQARHVNLFALKRRVNERFWRTGKVAQGDSGLLKSSANEIPIHGKGYTNGGPTSDSYDLRIEGIENDGEEMWVKGEINKIIPNWKLGPGVDDGFIIANISLNNVKLITNRFRGKMVLDYTLYDNIKKTYVHLDGTEYQKK